MTVTVVQTTPLLFFILFIFSLGLGAVFHAYQLAAVMLLGLKYP
jgi:ABC-type amino acid transport system permease subunit